MAESENKMSVKRVHLNDGLGRIYIPKGGMCATCIWVNANCSHLEFVTMPVIGTNAEGEIIVRCTAHLRPNAEIRG